MIFTPRTNRQWNETGLPGVQTCQTWTDGSNDGGYFARFKAGASFPRHTHVGWEQLLVLEGVIRFNDIEMRAGDVMQVEGADEHGAIAVEDTLLFVAHHGGIKMQET